MGSECFLEIKFVDYTESSFFFSSCDTILRSGVKYALEIATYRDGENKNVHP